MTSMTSLWNFERAVVPLFVSRVVFSLPFSLLSHALAAFYVEIRLENFPPISQFKTRFAASPDAILVTQSWVCSSEINRASTPHFPSCASVGKALLLTAGLVLHFGDMLTCTLLKVNQELTSLDMTFSGSGNVGRKIGIIIQGVLLGLLVFPLIFKVIF